MNDDTKDKPPESPASPVQLGSTGYGAVWSAREGLIRAARELVGSIGAGAVDLVSLRELAAALEKYDAVIAGEIPEPGGPEP
jgi:hypothetical protein